MLDIRSTTSEVVEGRVLRLLDSEHPITFTQYVNMVGPKVAFELVSGTLVAKPVVQLDHARAQGWLYHVLDLYVKARRLGMVFHSRFPVEINEFGGRLPDLMFVATDGLDSVRPKGVFSAPDLIIEIISPNDRPSDILALETDYRSLGVGEIVFVDQKRERMRVLTRSDGSYQEALLSSGVWASSAVAGFRLDVEWLLREPRPYELETIQNLLAQPTPKG